ncbi:RNA methyltransferase [Limibacillus halophilus]|nr:RNA methyltransferase [Limibacillus halophilus]
MRGYFGFGVQQISKPMNLGSLMRSAHAFGASFFFTIDPDFNPKEVKLSDTSDAAKNLPLYTFPTVGSLTLPRECRLVGVELTDDAVDLPSFHHPHNAAYVLGPERGSLSPELIERCDQVVKIPTKFCVNVGVAGAIVMYDRMRSLGRFAPRAVGSLGGPGEKPPHVSGGPVLRRRKT